MTDIYNDDAYLAHNPTWGEESSEWKARQIKRMLDGHQITPISICEVGCGTGAILASLRQSMPQDAVLEGYDVSRHAFEESRKKTCAGLSFHLADFLTLTESRHYDVLLVIDVIKHIEDAYGFLRGLRSRSTHKVFHIPLDLSLQTVLRSRPILRTRRQVGHLHYFTKETAIALLEDTGYQIIDAHYTAHSLELPNRGWKSNLLRWPRRIAYGLHKDLAVRVLGGASLLVLPGNR